MAEDVLFDDEKVRFLLNRSIPALEWVFKPNNNIGGRQLLQYMQRFYDVFVSEKAAHPRLVGAFYDMRHFAGMDEATTDHITTTVAHDFFVAGLCCEAIVLPQEMFALMALEDYATEVKGLTVHVFDNKAEALDWLRTQTQQYTEA